MRETLGHLAPIGLGELRAELALQHRVERKYLTGLDRVEAMLEGLSRSHCALEIDGLREFAYRTTYYDSPDLMTLHEHLQNRRRRFKCRRRFYLDTGVGSLEIKRKGLRGHTVKHWVPCDAGGQLDVDEVRFLRACIGLTYDRRIAFEAFQPTLTVNVRRITLASRELGERVTIDVAVEVPGWHLEKGLAIVETKSRHGRGAADGVLRRLGVYPRRASKYCAGMALNDPAIRANAYRPLLRAFVPEPFAPDVPPEAPRPEAVARGLTPRTA